MSTICIRNVPRAGNYVSMNETALTNDITRLHLYSRMKSLKIVKKIKSLLTKKDMQTGN
jgi:hypothetical protein